jgi:hypothetical protein
VGACQVIVADALDGEAVTLLTGFGTLAGVTALEKLDGFD